MLQCRKFDVFGGAPVYSPRNNKVVGMFAAKDNDYGYAIPVEEIVQKFKSISITSPPALHENNEIESKLFSREELVLMRNYASC
jgi:hypothetical protein